MWARMCATSDLPLPCAAAGLGDRKEGREGEAELQMKLAELHSAIYLQASLAGQHQGSRRC